MRCRSSVSSSSAGTSVVVVRSDIAGTPLAVDDPHRGMGTGLPMVRRRPRIPPAGSPEPGAVASGSGGGASGPVRDVARVVPVAPERADPATLELGHGDGPHPDPRADPDVGAD